MCQWKPVSEATWLGHRTLPAPASWWWLRREIEEAMNIHSRRQTKANLQHHYLAGFLVDDGEMVELQSNDVVPVGSRISVKRVPVDTKYYKQYCQRMPPTHEQWWKMNEDERLSAVLNMTFNDMVYVGDAAKADLALQDQEPEFDDTLQCSACGRIGHGHWHCPKKREKGFVPLSKRQLPHGIPASKLRTVASEADLDSAYKTADGRLVVMK